MGCRTLATGLNGWLYWSHGIYGDMLLEGLYFLSMGYGWYQWQRIGTVKKPFFSPREKQFNRQYSLALILLFAVLFLLSYYLLKTFTQSTVVLMDAITTSLSLIAQLLMCHKIIFTWIVWFITDFIYGLMYFQKALPYHSLLMLLYMGMAVGGYWVWAKRTNDPVSLPSLASI